jgi:tetratricopeptide (TPR) repeat protein
MKYIDYRRPERQTVLSPTDEFVDLICNATWYLYEMGDYALGVSIVRLGKSICKNETSAQFARLCSTQGANYYELNRAADCRTNWELALRLRQEASADFSKSDIHARADLAISFHNLGNMEGAAGNHEKALEYFGRAVGYRIHMGDTAAIHLATTYLGIGRCYVAQKKFEDARKMYGQAEQLFIRVLGAQKHFMAHCH